MFKVLDGVPWPDIVIEFSFPFSLANLDFLAVLAKTTCGINVRFYDSFVLHMALAFGCLITVLLAYLVVRICCIQKGDLEKKEQVKELASKATILIILLIYPGLST